LTLKATVSAATDPGGGIVGAKGPGSDPGKMPAPPPLLGMKLPPPLLGMKLPPPPLLGRKLPPLFGMKFPPLTPLPIPLKPSVKNIYQIMVGNVKL